MRRPKCWIKTTEYAAVLIAEITLRHPAMTWEERARMIGFSRRTIYRMRHHKHRLSWPQQLHLESLLPNDVADRLRARWSNRPSGHYWQSRG